MSGGGGGGEQKNEPWGLQKTYLAKGFPRIEEEVLNRPLEFFPGQGYVPLSPETEAGLGAATARAEAGSPLLSGAQDYTQGVLSGDYLSPESNPFFAGAADSVLSQVQPAVASQFGAAGRSGTSPLAAEALGRGVSRGLAPYMFGEYGRERGIQEAAAGRAPALAREDYYDPSQLAAVGAQREGLSARQLADEKARHDFEQQEQTERLRQYMQLIQGNYGGTTSTSGGGLSSGEGALGGALSGAAIGGTVGGPYGAGIGAGVGGLGGYFAGK